MVLFLKQNKKRTTVWRMHPRSKFAGQISDWSENGAKSMG